MAEVALSPATSPIQSLLTAPSEATEAALPLAGTAVTDPFAALLSTLTAAAGTQAAMVAAPIAPTVSATPGLVSTPDEVPADLGDLTAANENSADSDSPTPAPDSLAEAISQGLIAVLALAQPAAAAASSGSVAQAPIEAPRAAVMRRGLPSAQPSTSATPAPQQSTAAVAALEDAPTPPGLAPRAAATSDRPATTFSAGLELSTLSAGSVPAAPTPQNAAPAVVGATVAVAGASSLIAPPIDAVPTPALQLALAAIEPANEAPQTGKTVTPASGAAPDRGTGSADAPAAIKASGATTGAQLMTALADKATAPQGLGRMARPEPFGTVPLPVDPAAPGQPAATAASAAAPIEVQSFPAASTNNSASTAPMATSPDVKALAESKTGPARQRSSAETTSDPAAAAIPVAFSAPFADRSHLSVGGGVGAVAASPETIALQQQLNVAQDGQWLDALARDIAMSAGTGNDLHFKLNPAHLGALTVQIAQAVDGASIKITTESDAARTILQDAQPRLIAEARAQGLKVSDAQVDLSQSHPGGDSASMRQGEGSAGQNGQNRTPLPDHKPFRPNPAASSDLAESGDDMNSLYA